MIHIYSHEQQTIKSTFTLTRLYLVPSQESSMPFPASNDTILNAYPVP